MAYSSQSGQSPTSRSLILRPSHELSQRPARDDDAGSEVRQITSDSRTPGRITRKQNTTPTTYLPTSEELSRIERMMALQERMANLDKARVQGHTYGKLAVSGNARAIRGNLFEKSASPYFARSHTYGDCEVRDGGIVWNGDVCLTALQDYKKQYNSAGQAA